MNIDRSLAVSMFRKMLFIRKFEEGIADRYAQGEMRCPTHLSIGQEAAAVGVCSALASSDFAVSGHRAHAHYLAKGGNPEGLLAEIYGKESGCSRGRGGSMHLVDLSVGFYGSTAIVGNSVPIGVGLALAAELNAEKCISVIFLGDGCMEEGVVYESINFAVVRKLPVLFVCENNGYSVYSNLAVRQPEGRKISLMTQGIGVRSAEYDGNNVEVVFSATEAAAQSIKSGGGPVFIELSTYRWREHCGPNFDDDLEYRPAGELAGWMRRDPVARYKDVLQSRGWLEYQQLLEVESEISLAVATMFDRVRALPDAAPNDLSASVYAP